MAVIYRSDLLLSLSKTSHHANADDAVPCTVNLLQSILANGGNSTALCLTPLIVCHIQACTVTIYGKYMLQGFSEKVLPYGAG